MGQSISVGRDSSADRAHHSSPLRPRNRGKRGRRKRDRPGPGLTNTDNNPTTTTSNHRTTPDHVTSPSDHEVEQADSTTPPVQRNPRARRPFHNSRRNQSNPESNPRLRPNRNSGATVAISRTPSNRRSNDPSRRSNPDRGTILPTPNGSIPSQGNTNSNQPVNVSSSTSPVRYGRPEKLGLQRKEFVNVLRKDYTGSI